MRFIKDNIWTWAGTGLALITLSGTVQSQAMLITGFALLVQCVLALFVKDEE
jgi:hypothetical protein